MREQFLARRKVIPPYVCDGCGGHTDNQMYELRLDRPTLTRAWRFCTLDCVRRWSRKP